AAANFNLPAARPFPATASLRPDTATESWTCQNATWRPPNSIWTRQNRTWRRPNSTWTPQNGHFHSKLTLFAKNRPFFPKTPNPRQKQPQPATAIARATQG